MSSNAYSTMIKLKIKTLGFFLFLFLSVAQIFDCQNGDKAYGVGYKSIVYKDYSRDNGSLKKELLLMDSTDNCRVLTTSMWYPSIISESDKRVKFGDFLSTIELNDKKDYNVKDSILSPAAKFADYYNVDKSHLSSLINYQTQSFLNPKHFPEKLPLVIYSGNEWIFF